jgi:hypothetical protein
MGRNQRVGLERGDARRIMRQEFCLHVGIDEKHAFELLPERDALLGEGHIKFHAEGRGGEHQRPDPWGIVMHPSRRQHRANRLRHDRDVVMGKTVALGDLLDETIDVAHRRGEGGRVAALAGRAAVAARIPCVEGVIGHVEFVDQMRHARAVLVAAMEQHDGATRLARARRPEAVEQFSTVMGGEGTLHGVILPVAAFGFLDLLKHCCSRSLCDAERRADAVEDGDKREQRQQQEYPTRDRRQRKARADNGASMPSAAARSLLPSGPS